MNQILAIPKRKSKNMILFFKIELIFSILLLLACLCYIPYLLYNGENRDQLSSQILDQYYMTRLYTPTTISIDQEEIFPSVPFILGTISIEKLRNPISNTFSIFR